LVLTALIFLAGCFNNYNCRGDHWSSVVYSNTKSDAHSYNPGLHMQKYNYKLVYNQQNLYYLQRYTFEIKRFISVD
jgi:hypothetical protein